MNFLKACVHIDDSEDRIQVVDVDAYDQTGAKYNLPSRQFVEDLNQLPGLDRDKIQSVVARQFHIPLNCVETD
ncbi:MAG TPA: hypothetical protein VHO71_02580 [Caproiciproducens sp.]|nr:hypothetical protein [Caproiciproducens sp.]